MIGGIMDYPKLDHAAVVSHNRQTFIWAAIKNERARQDQIFGEQNHDPFKWLSILLEEVGEVAKAINDHHWSQESAEAIKDELIQVAAVAVAAIESLQRQGLIE